MIGTPNVGRTIRDIRKRKRLLQRAVASAAGMSANSLSSIEMGDTDPRLSALRSIARALEVPLAEVLSLTDAPR